MKQTIPKEKTSKRKSGINNPFLEMKIKALLKYSKRYEERKNEKYESLAMLDKVLNVVNDLINEWKPNYSVNPKCRSCADRDSFIAKLQKEIREGMA